MAYTFLGNSWLIKDLGDLKITNDLRMNGEEVSEKVQKLNSQTV